MSDRCAARDAHGKRCIVVGEHDVIINSKGQRAVPHQTASSLWSVPIHDLQVVKALPQDPGMLGAMLDRARHATPEDVIAGGANNEEELMACLRLGFMRGVDGNEPGPNTLGFVIWPNGQRAFQAGWDFAKQQDVARIIKEARA